MGYTLVGLDLGQSRDYKALAVLRVSWKTMGGAGMVADIEVPHLKRYALGTKYPDIIGDVADLMRRREVCGAQLVVDATGVGRPVLDDMQASGLQPIGITITAGNAPQRVDAMDWTVPKRDLVSTMAVLLQNGRLHIAAALEHAPTLTSELSNFKATITLAGNDTYGADAPWREGNHDDLVFAVALPAWYGMKHPPLQAGSFLSGGERRPRTRLR